MKNRAKTVVLLLSRMERMQFKVSNRLENAFSQSKATFSHLQNIITILKTLRTHIQWSIKLQISNLTIKLRINAKIHKTLVVMVFSTSILMSHGMRTTRGRRFQCLCSQFFMLPMEIQFLVRTCRADHNRL